MSDTRPPRRSLRWRLFALAQALVWGGIAATALALSGQPDTTGIDVRWLIVANFATAATLTSGIAIGLHAWHRHPRRGGLLTAAMVCGAPAMAAALHVAMAVGSGAVLGDSWSFAGFASASSMGVARPALLYLLWMLGYVAAAVMLQRRDSRRHLARLEQMVRDSELELLKDQFDPHFLFNVLTLLQAESGNSARVEEITQRLSQYLRAATNSGRELVRIGQQADECLAYLHLQRARFGPRLSWRVDVDDAVSAAVLPSLTVQTLVEHAVRTSLEQTGEPAEVLIVAGEAPGGVRLEVQFPGTASEADSTSSPEPTSRAAHRHALRNLRRRLELLCGPTARLAHSATAGVVTLAIESPKLPPHEAPEA